MAKTNSILSKGTILPRLRSRAVEISEDHVEFAIVARMRGLLEDDHSPWEVTATYTHFAGILCWVVQRLRTDSNKDLSTAAKAASSVWKSLESEPVDKGPWSVQVGSSSHLSNMQEGTTAHASQDFEGRSAADMLRNLRNAVAHGDARKVEPLHQAIGAGPGRALVGFKFLCEDRKDRSVTWTGSISLRRTDMIRIGSALAERYCQAMKQASSWSHLAEDSHTALEEAA